MQKKILQDVQDSLKKAADMPVRELGDRMRVGLKNAVLKSVSPAGDDTSLREKAESLLAAARAASPDTKRQAQLAFSDSLRTVHSLCLAGVGRVGNFVAIQSAPREKKAGFSMATGGNSSPQSTPPQTQRRTDGNSSAAPRGNFSAPQNPYSVPSLEGEKKIYTSGRMSHRTNRSSSPLAWVSVGIAALMVAAAGCYLMFQTPQETEEEIPVALSIDQIGPSAENIESVSEMPLATPLDDDNPSQRARASSKPLPKQVELTRDGVNLRDGHSTKGTNILARLDRQRMNVLERWEGATETWYRLETDQGVGWVIGLYLQEAAPASERKSAPSSTPAPAPAPATASASAPTPAPAPAPAPAPTAKPETKPEAKPAVKTTPGFVKGTSVNVRDGHSTRGTNILTKYSNRDVEILDSWHGKGDPFPWYKIKTENGEGWMYGQYIELR